MALSLNKPKLDNLAGDIWKSAERLRGKFKSYEYQGVILPIIVIKNDRQATVHVGNSLIPHDPPSKERGDQWPEPKWRFNRMLSNPPFGVTWGGKDGFYRYQPPTPAKDLLAEFWRLEKEAEKMLEGLASQ